MALHPPLGLPRRPHIHLPDGYPEILKSSASRIRQMNSKRLGVGKARLEQDAIAATLELMAEGQGA